MSNRVYYKLNKYYMTKNGKVFDTTFLHPHVECYFVEDNKLYCEMIDGTEHYWGEIIAHSDDLSDLEEMGEKYSA